MHFDMLLQKALAELFHRRRCLPAVAFTSGIAAQANLGQVLHCLRPGEVRRNRSVQADIHNRRDVS